MKDEVSPSFEEEERAKASAHTPPRLIHEIIREEGETELRRPVSAGPRLVRARFRVISMGSRS